MLPGNGVISVISGGNVSFGPPLGGVVVLAQECENIIIPRIIVTGIAGSRFISFFFIYFVLLFSLNICSDHALNAFYLLQPSDQLFQIPHVVYIKVNMSFEYAIFGFKGKLPDIHTHYK